MTTKEFLDIATKHASSEEAVRAVIVQSNAKAAPSDGRGAPTKATNKGARRGARSNKWGPKWRPQQVVVTTSCDEGDNDKDDGDSDEELVAATERGSMR
jgi:hypothetical protein